MAVNQKFSLTLLFLGVVFVTHFHESSSSCSFRPVNNQSLVEKVYPYFDKDNDVIIVEYTIRLMTSSFDWSENSDTKTFQPWRWFRTQGSGNSRLLLSFYYYLGLFKDYMSLKYRTAEVLVILEMIPEGCMENLTKTELVRRLGDYLLRDFDINPKAVKHPYTPSNEVNVCSMYINEKRNGAEWLDNAALLTYRCCKYDKDDDTKQTIECEDLHQNGWVLALKIFMIILSIFLFLLMPTLIQVGNPVSTYEYTPSEEMQFNIVMTSDPDQFSSIKNSTRLNVHEWKNLPGFNKKVSQLKPDTIYGAHVKRVDCHVNNDMIAQKNVSLFSFSESLYTFFVLYKVRPKTQENVEECCHTSIGGNCSKNIPGDPCSRCPTYQSCLRALNVIIFMSIVSLPSVPLFCVLMAHNQNYEELYQAQKDRGLNPTVFYPGSTANRICFGIISGIYFLNTIILAHDEATDRQLTTSYVNLLEAFKENLSLKTMETMKIIINISTCLQKTGIIMLLLCLVVIIPLSVLASIVLCCFAFVLACKKEYERLKPDAKTKFKKIFIKLIFFIISLFSVFIVITMGINLIVHVMAMILIEIIVNASNVYKVLPVVLILLFYIRDCYNRACERYRKYLDIVLKSLVSRESGKLQEELKNRNQLFQVSQVEFEQDSGTEDKPTAAAGSDAGTDTIASSDSGSGEKNSLFQVYRGTLWICLQRVLLLSKEKVISTTKEFMFQASDMECYGVPGQLEENFIMACLDFLKIAVFLLFVFIALMAYGSIYSITTTSQLIITLITGLVPLVIKSLNTNNEMVDAASFKFQFELDQKTNSFVQSWELQDIIIDSVVQKPNGSTVTNDQPMDKTSTLSTLILLKDDTAGPTVPIDLNTNTSEPGSTDVINTSSGDDNGTDEPANNINSGNTRTGNEASGYQTDGCHIENEEGISLHESTNPSIKKREKDTSF